MVTEILVNIGSGNGLLPDGTKPLPEPMLTDHQLSPVTFILGQFHKRFLNQELLKIHLKITYLKFHSNFPGANELITYSVTWPCSTVLMLLKMVMEYCQCADDIPSVTADILSRLIELLKMFNSRTCQLILGAGALQLVGLRTITTKNLGRFVL